MRTAAWALLVLLAPQDDFQGRVRISFKGSGLPESNCSFYRKDVPYLDAILQASQQYHGPDTPADVELLVQPSSQQPDEAKKTLTFTLPVGTYSLRVPYRPGTYVWLDPLKVVAKGVLERPADFLAPASLKASWTIDAPLQAGDGGVLLNASLVRDGRVWAYAGGVRSKQVQLKDVPPGTYSLVLQETFEGFCWFKEDVKLEAGKETSVTVEVRRPELGGVTVEFVDPSGKTILRRNQARVALVEEKGRIAASPGMFARGSLPNDRYTWTGMPVGGTYTVHGWMEGYKPGEKRGLKLKPPAPGKSGGQEYPVVKVTLALEK